MSDGARLHAVRYASDDQAPTLYHRWLPSGGRAVVSEPLANGEAGWEIVPPGSFCTFEGEAVTIRPFVPELRAAA
jgi:glutamine amidotransferase